jgi:hypothetical protein
MLSACAQAAPVASPDTSAQYVLPPQYHRLSPHDRKLIDQAQKLLDSSKKRFDWVRGQ